MNTNHYRNENQTKLAFWVVICYRKYSFIFKGMNNNSDRCTDSLFYVMILVIFYSKSLQLWWSKRPGHQLQFVTSRTSLAQTGSEISWQVIFSLLSSRGSLVINIRSCIFGESFKAKWLTGSTLSHYGDWRRKICHMHMVSFQR